MMLETKTDNMKNLTEKLKNNSAAVLVPNPGIQILLQNFRMLFLFYLAARAESLFFDSVPVDKIGKKIICYKLGTNLLFFQLRH